MAELLKLPHLVQEHGMAEMNIRGRGVEPGLHAERLFRREGPLQLLQEVILKDDLHRAALYDLKLFLCRMHILLKPSLATDIHG